jgi:hypothetical protein
MDTVNKAETDDWDFDTPHATAAESQRRVRRLGDRAEWWFNELGMPMHLGCGCVGRYEVCDGRHYVACRGCNVGKRVPAPSVPYWHAMYRKHRDRVLVTHPPSCAARACCMKDETWTSRSAAFSTSERWSRNVMEPIATPRSLPRLGAPRDLEGASRVLRTVLQKLIALSPHGKPLHGATYDPAAGGSRSANRAAKLTRPCTTSTAWPVRSS